jgi:lipopolysaccharide/colanic/teichoic acid biosynthesis glycosyltransferase
MPASHLVKAGMDRLVAAVALVLLVPVLIGVAVAVRMSSAGPALFLQQRVGRNQVVFRLVKFRSMYEDAEERRYELLGRNDHEGPLFKLRQDPRVTPLGRLLRRYSLDELPQLINVLRGEMSLVGPRPLLPAEAEGLPDDARFSVKPGMTGLWQVGGRCELSWLEGLALDRRYAEEWTLWLDLRILLRTALAVVRGRGAY